MKKRQSWLLRRLPTYDATEIRGSPYMPTAYPQQTEDDDGFQFRFRPPLRRAQRRQRTKALIMLVLVVLVFVLVAYRMAML